MGAALRRAEARAAFAEQHMAKACGFSLSLIEVCRRLIGGESFSDAERELMLSTLAEREPDLRSILSSVEAHEARPSDGTSWPQSQV